ncbi:hypothetical protein EV702DRAFT_1270022 [Suillus placidus]|uniref:Uncharacterized protein n=1 Tax=Suillus placidus TaxID=48579 RepID=A0A9P6ZPJ3_9AGAM|nr:hypothetical protein EV702DRAFT_1270022 [Suillus placidus]
MKTLCLSAVLAFLHHGARGSPRSAQGRLLNSITASAHQANLPPAHGRDLRGHLAHGRAGETYVPSDKVTDHGKKRKRADTDSNVRQLEASRGGTWESEVTKKAGSRDGVCLLRPAPSNFSQDDTYSYSLLEMVVVTVVQVPITVADSLSILGHGLCKIRV